MIKPALADPKIPSTAPTVNQRVDGYGHATFPHEYATAFSGHSTLWCHGFKTRSKPNNKLVQTGFINRSFFGGNRV
jgi:hypothetical protein